MKKYGVLMLISCMVSCNHQLDESLIDSPHQFTENEVLQEMYQSTFEHVIEQPLVSTIINSDNSLTIRLSVSQISKSTQEYLANNYFNDIPFRLNHSQDYIYLDRFVNALSSTDTRTLGLGGAVMAMDEEGVFTPDQKSLLSNFINEIMNATDSYAMVEIINDFESLVNNAPYTAEEKLLLLQFSSGSTELINFMDSGGVEEIHSYLQNETGITTEASGRILGCSVDVRTVLIGAVVTGTVTAIKGGIAGATAGSFTVPLLGTAVGGLGGAVFGFASGFVGGAATTLVANLLATCFRATLTTHQDNQNQELTRNGIACQRIIDSGLSIPSDCFRYLDFKIG